jgi:hypothetical protein
MSLNGQPIGTGKLDETTFQSYTASIDPRISNLETSTGSINGFTSSTNLRLTSLETSTGSINTYTASNTTNIDAIHTSTSSLNTFTSSANGRLNSIEGVTGSISSLNTYTGSNNTIIGTLQTSTGSLNTFTSSASDRLNSIEISTGSLNTYTSSNITNINAIHTATASLNTFSSSANSRLSFVETSTGSLNSYTASNSTNINAIHTATSSLNSYTSSNTTAVNALNTSTASLNSYTSSNNTVINALNSYTSSNTTNINAIHTATSSLNSYTSSNTTAVNALNTSTASLNSYTSSNTTNINAIHTATGSLNSYTSSNTTNINAIHTSTSSLNSYTASNTTNINAIHTATASLNSFTSSATSRLNSIEGVTGSIAALNTYTGSNDSTNTAQNNRLGSLETKTGSLEGKTGSYATTGSNRFIGDQTITGSLFISQNLIVGGSSSINFVSQSTLNIGTNLITVNAQNPGTRFGGLAVIDSGSSPTVSGSMLFDSINDQWIFVHQAIAGSPTTSSVVLMGPESFNSLGSEIYPTTNRVVKSINSEHLGDSNISDTGTKVSINSNTEITGTFVATGTALVSGSAQISFNGITDKPTLVSGSSQITFLSISSIPSGLVSGSSQVLNGSGVWSGSAQLPAGTVSGSSQVLNGSGVWSGSAQLPSGVVSGSSQVLAGTTIHSGAFFNGISVVSGSAQISFNGITDKPALVSGSSQITFGSLTGLPSGLVSGSSQITFLSISNIPSGLVSGSSQVAFSSLSGLPSGIVSGSSQISFGSISGVPSGLVSGSSQITYGSLSGIPSGIVSGSSQISFGSISGIPSGLVSGSSQITFSGISSKPTTISGYGITDAITTGNISSQTVASAGNSTTVGGLTPIQFFNNMGDNHSTRTSFDASTPSYNFGFRYVQGNTNGPGTGASQYYSFYIGLGNDYPATGGGSYGAMFAVDRNSTTPYLSVRYNENNNFSSWRKIHAGYADTAGSATTAGSLSSMNISQFTNNTGYITGISFANVSSKPTTISGYGITDAITTGNIGSQSVSYATTAGALSSMNISQFTNNSGYITGIAFSSVSSKPTTLSGYGITDSLYQDRATIDVNAFNTTGLYRGSTSGWSNRPTSVHNGGALLQIDTHPGNYHTQLFFDTGGNRMYMRSADAGSWGSWVTMYHSGNLTNLNQLTNGPGYITGISFANVSSKPTTISGYGITDAITTGNIGSQSVSYASSAGSAPNGTNQNSVYNVTPGEGNGLRFWSEDNYKISMGVSSVYQYGTVSDYSIKTQMNSGDAGRGFTWGRIGVVPIASLNATSGNMQLAGSLTTGGSILPLSNNSVNLGSVSLGWANVYTNDLHLSNMNKPEGNDIDGTKGTWTIQEGEENLYIINNNNGKKFKISLEEII